MFKLMYVSLFTIWVVRAAEVNSCDYVGNLRVNYREVDNKTSTWDFIKVTNCLSDAAFNGKQPIHVWLINGALPKLEKNFISNMQILTEINIEKFHIETIEPGAFSNLPQLEKININTNPIKTISRGLFDTLPSLQIVQFYQTKVSFIEDHAFANLPLLKVIALNENNLDEMKRDWFTNTTNIKNFNMFGNSIQKIPLGMFHGWRKLKEIYLSSNAISVIEGELFIDNGPFMETINLHHNRLKSISPNTFSGAVYMAFLGLSGNFLNYLPEEFLKNVRVGNIALYSNPFTCPCLEKIQHILLEKGAAIDDPVRTYAKFCKDEGVPVCGVSSKFPGTCNESVDLEVSRQFFSYLKKIRFDTVYDSIGQQCATFDNLE